MEFSKFGRSNTILGEGRSKYPWNDQYPRSGPPPAAAPSSNQSWGRGEQQMHLTCHPQQPFLRITSSEPFTCMGCKEYGAGTRFACQHCDHQLHEFCAQHPTTLKTHPLHPQHPLQFSSKPVKGGGMLGKRCHVCNKATAGYTYSCSACSFQMHPCCAMLSTEMSFPLAHPHPLILMPNSSSGSSGGDSCGECGRKRSGRVYRCTAQGQGCHYHLHAVCAKNMVNGLRLNHIKVAALEKPSLLGAFSKVASLLVLEFVGGLLGGFGQDVGNALGQTIASAATTTKGITRS